MWFVLFVFQQLNFVRFILCYAFSIHHFLLLFLPFQSYVLTQAVWAHVLYESRKKSDLVFNKLFLLMAPYGNVSMLFLPGGDDSNILR